MNNDFSMRFAAADYAVVDNVATGYAVKWGSRSNLQWNDKMGKAIYSQFSPGAFDQTLTTGKGRILACVQHDRKQMLGKYPTTLQLSTDSIGLKYSLTLPDTQLGRDTKTMIARGDLGGLSVGVGAMDPKADVTMTRNPDSTWLLTWNRAILSEVSIVDVPCFSDSNVAIQQAVYAMQDELEAKEHAAEQQREQVRAWYQYKLRLLGM